MLVRLLAALLSLAVLAGCVGSAEPVWAPEAEVVSRRYVHDGPPTITLYTVQNAKNGSGGHSGLMINAPSQRVLFDPAGTFRHPQAPERNDVHFGITENVRKVYVDYHARETFNVLVQEKVVSPEVAEMALRAAQSYGAVPKARCSRAITRVLSELPGFESMPVSWFPNQTARAFGRFPGVTTTVVTDDDADANHGVLLQAAAEAAAAG